MKPFSRGTYNSTDEMLEHLDDPCPCGHIFKQGETCYAIEEGGEIVRTCPACGERLRFMPAANPN